MGRLAMELTDKRVFYAAGLCLKFLKKYKEKVTKVKVVPAKLGKRGFGRIEVEVEKELDYVRK